MKKYPIENEEHNTITIKARVNPKDIFYINSIIESYEGIGILRTKDASEGLVEILTNSHFKETIYKLLEDLSKETEINVYEEVEGYKFHKP